MFLLSSKQIWKEFSLVILIKMNIQTIQTRNSGRFSDKQVIEVQGGRNK